MPNICKYYAKNNLKPKEKENFNELWSQQYSNAWQVIVGDNEKAHVVILGRSNSWSTWEIIVERKEGNNNVVKSRIPWSKVHYANHNPMIFVPPGE